MSLSPLPIVIRKLGTPEWYEMRRLTLFHAASLCGSSQHGANEDAVDAENRSPLHWAGVC